ncbi:MAG: hypothetical protein IJ411_02865, partial [Oscillospiraceae bacterium]|nr:hypothetical protein [Oscillospiraceae bacterium]
EENLNGVKNWEDIRGIESPVFHSFKKAKLKEAERLIHSYFGNTLFLSDKSILDVSAAYNFLNAKDDHLKFANRTNSGHKAYSAQRYVRNWIKFEDGLHNKRVKELDVIKESAQRVGINLNTEMLAAQRVFLMYRYELQNVLDGERERRLEASRLGDYCARAIGKTILRYDIKAAVDACADALQMCMDVFRDLRMSGCLNKNVSSDSAEIPKDLFKNK